MAPVKGTKETTSFASSSCLNIFDNEYYDKEMEKLLRLEPTKEVSEKVINVINRIISNAKRAGPTAEHAKHIYECIQKLHQFNCKALETRHAYPLPRRTFVPELLVEYMKLEANVIQTFNKDTDYCDHLKKQILDLLYEIFSKVKWPRSTPREVWQKSLDVLNILPYDLPNVFNEIIDIAAENLRNCGEADEEYLLPGSSCLSQSSNKRERKAKKVDVIVIDDDDDDDHDDDDDKDLVLLQIRGIDSGYSKSNNAIHDTGQRHCTARKINTNDLSKQKPVVDMEVLRNRNNFNSRTNRKRRKEKVKYEKTINTDCVPNIKNSLVKDYLQNQPKYEEVIEILDNKKIKDFIMNRTTKTDKVSSSISTLSPSCSFSSYSSSIGLNYSVNTASISADKEKDNLVTSSINNNNNNKLSVKNHDVKGMYNKAKSKSESLDQIENCIQGTEDIYKKIQEFVQSGSTQMIIKKCDVSGNILILPADNDDKDSLSMPKNSLSVDNTDLPDSIIAAQNRCDDISHKSPSTVSTDTSTTSPVNTTQELVQIKEPNNQQPSQVSSPLPPSVTDDQQDVNCSTATENKVSPVTNDDTILSVDEEHLQVPHISLEKSNASEIVSVQHKDVQCMEIVPYVPLFSLLDLATLSNSNPIENTTENCNKIESPRHSTSHESSHTSEDSDHKVLLSILNEVTMEMESNSSENTNDIHNVEMSSSGKIQDTYLENQCRIAENVCDMQNSTTENECESAVIADTEMETESKDTCLGNENVARVCQVTCAEMSIDNNEKSRDRNGDSDLYESNHQEVIELQELLRSLDTTHPLPIRKSNDDDDLGVGMIGNENDMSFDGKRRTESETGDEFETAESETDESGFGSGSSNTEKSELNVSKEMTESSFELSPKSKKVIEDFIEKDESFRSEKDLQIASGRRSNKDEQNEGGPPSICSTDEYSNGEMDYSAAEDNLSENVKDNKITLRTSDLLNGYELEIVSATSRDGFVSSVEDQRQNDSIVMETEAISTGTKNENMSLVNEAVKDIGTVDIIKLILVDILSNVESKIDNLLTCTSEQIAVETSIASDEPEAGPETIICGDICKPHNGNENNFNNVFPVENQQSDVNRQSASENKTNELKKVLKDRQKSMYARSRSKSDSEILLKFDDQSIVDEDMRLTVNLSIQQRRNGERWCHDAQPQVNMNVVAAEFTKLTTSIETDHLLNATDKQTENLWVKNGDYHLQNSFVSIEKALDHRFNETSIPVFPQFQDPYTNVPLKADKICTSTIENSGDEILVLAEAASKCKKLPLPDPNSFKNIPQHYETCNIYDHARKLDQENCLSFSRSKTPDGSDSDCNLLIDEGLSENAATDNRSKDSNDLVVDENVANSSTSSIYHEAVERLTEFEMLVTNARGPGVVKKGKSMMRSKRSQNYLLTKQFNNYQSPNIGNSFLVSDNYLNLVKTALITKHEPTYPKVPRVKNKHKKTSQSLFPVPVKPIRSSVYDSCKMIHKLEDTDDVPLAFRVELLPTKKTKSKAKKTRSKRTLKSPSSGKIQTEYVAKLRSRSTSNDAHSGDGGMGTALVEHSMLKPDEFSSNIGHRSDSTYEERPPDDASNLMAIFKKPPKKKHANSEMTSAQINNAGGGRCATRRKTRKPKKISNVLEEEVDDVDCLDRMSPTKNKPKMIKNNKANNKLDLKNCKDTAQDQSVSTSDTFAMTNSVEHVTVATTTPPKTPKERCKQALKEQKFNYLTSPNSSGLIENTLPVKLRRKRDLLLSSTNGLMTNRTALFQHCKNTTDSNLIEMLKERCTDSKSNKLDDLLAPSSSPPLEKSRALVAYNGDFLRLNQALSKNGVIFNNHHMVYNNEQLFHETPKLTNHSFLLDESTDELMKEKPVAGAAQLVEEAIKNLTFENQLSSSQTEPDKQKHFWDANVALEVSVNSTDHCATENPEKTDSAVNSMRSRYNDINSAIVADFSNISVENSLETKFSHIQNSSVVFKRSETINEEKPNQSIPDYSTTREIDLNRTTEINPAEERNATRETILKFGKVCEETNIKVQSDLNVEKENGILELGLKLPNSCSGQLGNTENSQCAALQTDSEKLLPEKDEVLTLQSLDSRPASFDNSIECDILASQSPNIVEPVLPKILDYQEGFDGSTSENNEKAEDKEKEEVLEQHAKEFEKVVEVKNELSISEEAESVGVKHRHVESNADNAEIASTKDVPLIESELQPTNVMHSEQAPLVEQDSELNSLPNSIDKDFNGALPVAEDDTTQTLSVASDQSEQIVVPNLKISERNEEVAIDPIKLVTGNDIQIVTEVLESEQSYSEMDGQHISTNELSTTAESCAPANIDLINDKKGSSSDENATNEQVEPIETNSEVAVENSQLATVQRIEGESIERHDETVANIERRDDNLHQEMTSSKVSNESGHVECEVQNTEPDKLIADPKIETGKKDTNQQLDNSKLISWSKGIESVIRKKMLEESPYILLERSVVSNSKKVNYEIKPETTCDYRTPLNISKVFRRKNVEKYRNRNDYNCEKSRKRKLQNIVINKAMRPITSDRESSEYIDILINETRQHLESLQMHNEETFIRCDNNLFLEAERRNHLPDEPLRKTDNNEVLCTKTDNKNDKSNPQESSKHLNNEVKQLVDANDKPVQPKAKSVINWLIDDNDKDDTKANTDKHDAIIEKHEDPSNVQHASTFCNDRIPTDTSEQAFQENLMPCTNTKVSIEKLDQVDKRSNGVTLTVSDPTISIGMNKIFDSKAEGLIIEDKPHRRKNPTPKSLDMRKSKRSKSRWSIDEEEDKGRKQTVQSDESLTSVIHEKSTFSEVINSKAAETEKCKASASPSTTIETNENKHSLTNDDGIIEEKFGKTTSASPSAANEMSENKHKKDDSLKTDGDIIQEKSRKRTRSAKKVESTNKEEAIALNVDKSYPVQPLDLIGTKNEKKDLKNMNENNTDKRITTNDELPSTLKASKDEKKSSRKLPLPNKIEEKAVNELMKKKVNKNKEKDRSKLDSSIRRSKNDGESSKGKNSNKTIDNVNIDLKRDIEVKKAPSVRFAPEATVIIFETDVKDTRCKTITEKNEISLVNKQSPDDIQKLRKKSKKSERKSPDEQRDMKSTNRTDRVMETRLTKLVANSDKVNTESKIKEQKPRNPPVVKQDEKVLKSKASSTDDSKEVKLKKGSIENVSGHTAGTENCDKKMSSKKNKKDKQTNVDSEITELNKKTSKSEKERKIFNDDETIKSNEKSRREKSNTNQSISEPIVDAHHKKAEKKSDKSKLATITSKRNEQNGTKVKTNDLLSSGDQSINIPMTTDKSNKSSRKLEKSDSKTSDRRKKSHENAHSGSGSLIEKEVAKTMQKTNSANIVKNVQTENISEPDKETSNQSTLMVENRKKENAKTQSINSVSIKQAEVSSDDSSKSKHRKSGKSHKRRKSEDINEPVESKRRRTKTKDDDKRRTDQNEQVDGMNAKYEPTKSNETKKGTVKDKHSESGKRNNSISKTIEFVVNYTNADQVQKSEEKPTAKGSKSLKENIITIEPNQKKDDKSSHRKRSREADEIKGVPNKIAKSHSQRDSTDATDTQTEKINSKSKDRTKNKDGSMESSTQKVEKVKEDGKGTEVSNKKPSKQNCDQKDQIDIMPISSKDISAGNDEIKVTDDHQIKGENINERMNNNEKMNQGKRRKKKHHEKDGIEPKHSKYDDQNLDTVDNIVIETNNEKLNSKMDDLTTETDEVAKLNTIDVPTHGDFIVPNVNLETTKASEFGITSINFNVNSSNGGEPSNHVAMPSTEISQLKRDLPLAETKSYPKNNEENLLGPIEEQLPVLRNPVFYHQEKPVNKDDETNCKDNSNECVNTVSESPIPVNNAVVNTIEPELPCAALPGPSVPLPPLQPTMFYQNAEPTETANNAHTEKTFINKEAFNSLLNFEDVNELANKTEEEIKNAGNLLKIPQIVPTTVSVVEEMVKQLTTTAAAATIATDSIIESVAIPPAAAATVPDLSESCAVQAAYKSLTVNAQELELLNFDSDPQRPSVLPDFFDHRDEFIHEEKSSSNAMVGTVQSCPNLQMSTNSFFNDKQLFAGSENDLRAPVMSSGFTPVTSYVSTSSCAVVDDKGPTTIGNFYDSKTLHHPQFEQIGQTNQYSNIDDALTDNFYEQYMSVTRPSSDFDTNGQTKMSTCNINNIEMNLLNGFLGSKQEQKSELILNGQTKKSSEVLHSQYDKLLQDVNNEKHLRSEGNGTASGDHTYTRNPVLGGMVGTIDEQNNLKLITIENPATEFPLDVMDLSFIDSSATSSDILGSTTGSWTFDNTVTDPIDGLPAWDENDVKTIRMPSVETISSQNQIAAANCGDVMNITASGPRNNTVSSGDVANTDVYRKVVVERQPYSDFDPYSYSYMSSHSLTSINSCKYTSASSSMTHLSEVESATKKSVEIANLSKVAKLIEKQLPKDLMEKDKKKSSVTVPSKQSSTPPNLPRREVVKKSTTIKPKAKEILNIPTRRKVIVTPSKVPKSGEAQSKESKQTQNTDQQQIKINDQKNKAMDNTKDTIKSEMKPNPNKNMSSASPTWLVTPKTQMAYVNSIKSFEEEVIGQKTLSEVQDDTSTANDQAKGISGITTSTKSTGKYSKSIHIMSNILIAPPLRLTEKSLPRIETLPLDQSAPSKLLKQPNSSKPKISDAPLKRSESSPLPQLTAYPHVSTSSSRAQQILNKSLSCNVIKNNVSDQKTSKKTYDVSTSNNVKVQIERNPAVSNSRISPTTAGNTSPSGYDQKMQKNRKLVKTLNEVKIGRDKSPAQRYSITQMDNSSRNRNNYDSDSQKSDTEKYRTKNELKQSEPSPGRQIRSNNSQKGFYIDISPVIDRAAESSDNNLPRVYTKSHKPSSITIDTSKKLAAPSKSLSQTSSGSASSSYFDHELLEQQQQQQHRSLNSKPIATVRPTVQSVVQSQQKNKPRRGCINIDQPLQWDICETRTKTREMKIALKESKRTESADDMNAEFDKLLEKGPTNPNFSLNRNSGGNQLQSSAIYGSNKPSHLNNDNARIPSPGTSNIRSTKQQSDYEHKTLSRTDLSDKVRTTSQSNNNHHHSSRDQIKYSAFPCKPLPSPNNTDDEWWKVLESRAPSLLQNNDKSPIFYNDQSE